MNVISKMWLHYLLGRSLVRTTKDKVLKGNTFGRITFTLDYQGQSFQNYILKITTSSGKDFNAVYQVITCFNISCIETIYPSSFIKKMYLLPLDTYNITLVDT